MNARERLLATLNFDRSVHTMRWELGYWGATVRRWYGEGLPRKTGIPDSVHDGVGVHAGFAGWDYTRVRDRDVHDFFGLDTGMRRIPVNIQFSPAFEPTVLEDRGETVITLDERGRRMVERKDRASLPHEIGWPVSNRDDWERIKAERLQPTLEGRLPDNWPQVKEELRNRDFPLAIAYGVGFFGTPRYFMGPEGLLTAYVEQPELIADMINYLCDFWIALFDQVLDQVDADLAVFWEDMAYKSGSMISPRMFRKFMMPAYKKMTGFLRERGINIVTLDTDGDCWELIPLFMESGVTGLWPFECQAGMDVVEVRKAFPNLQIMGGLDKTKVAAGRAAIDAELDYKIPFMLQQGGYIPFLDHNVPPDISWDDFVYYRRKLNQMIEASGR